MERIFVDSTVFIKYARGEDDFLLRLVGNELYTSINVFEECFYKLLLLKCGDITGKISVYKLKDSLKKNYNAFKGVFEFMDFFESLISMKVIHLLQINFKVLKIMREIVKKYRLLPNDALIAATCKYYGIKKIATFDDDFKKVDFLKVIDQLKL